MDIGKRTKIILCLIMMAALLTGCVGGKSYYSLKNEEIPETETVEQNESEIDSEEPMPEEYEEYDYSYTDHDYDFSAYTFSENYINAICAAINNGDFTLVQPYLKRNSALYNAQKSRVEKLYSKGEKEYVLSCQVEDIDWINKQKGTLILYEMVDTIDSAGKSSIAEVTYEYKIEYVNGRYVLSDRLKQKKD